ncbi:REP-associated tyrosine transposase [Pontibacillus marinus]|uniref:REP-associated tyrosine transposase n=1 Tax=Pontibacillus marinus TaxID=273164 RepID=UPI0004183760|nr:transposase [Pontibacillus marinus]
MARNPRIWYPGAMFHITARGNRGSSLFNDEADFNQYLDLVKLCQTEYPFKLHAYCLMTNHIHLLIEVDNYTSGEIMKFIQFKYAKYYNKRYEVTGHLFQGRYYANVIKSIDYLLEVSKYIHLNPVKAGIVLSPESYRWSSYNIYMMSEVNNGFVDTSKVLKHFITPKQEQYKEYVNE